MTDRTTQHLAIILPAPADPAVASDVDADLSARATQANDGEAVTVRRRSDGCLVIVADDDAMWGELDAIAEDAGYAYAFTDSQGACYTVSL